MSNKMKRHETLQAHEYLRTHYHDVPVHKLPTLKAIAQKASNHLGFTVSRDSVSRSLEALGIRERQKKKPKQEEPCDTQAKPQSFTNFGGEDAFDFLSLKIAEAMNKICEVEGEITELRDDIQILNNRDSSRYQKICEVEINSTNRDEKLRNKMNSAFSRLRDIEDLLKLLKPQPPNDNQGDTDGPDPN